MKVCEENTQLEGKMNFWDYPGIVPEEKKGDGNEKSEEERTVYGGVPGKAQKNDSLCSAERVGPCEIYP